MTKSPGAIYKRDFWADENTKYARPHFRMLKVARLVNRLAAGRDCRLFDVDVAGHTRPSPRTEHSLLRDRHRDTRAGVEPEGM